MGRSCTASSIQTVNEWLNPAEAQADMTVSQEISFPITTLWFVERNGLIIMICYNYVLFNISNVYGGGGGERCLTLKKKKTKI
jgi:hypothetical protein